MQSPRERSEESERKERAVEMSNRKVKWDAQLKTFFFLLSSLSLSLYLYRFCLLLITFTNSKNICFFRFNCSTDLYSHLRNLFLLFSARGMALNFSNENSSFDLESLLLARQNAIVYCHRLWNRIVYNFSIRAAFGERERERRYCDCTSDKKNETHFLCIKYYYN